MPLVDRSYPAVLRMMKTKRLLGYQAGAEWRAKKTEVRRFLEQGNHPDSLKKD